MRPSVGGLAGATRALSRLHMWQTGLSDSSAVDTTFVGGPGNDTVIYNVVDGIDIVHGGTGIDTEARELGR